MMLGSRDRLPFWLLLVALVSAAALCLPALQGQALALDEHGSYYLAGAPTLRELWNRTDQVTALPPLTHLFERLALAIGGHSENSLRIPSLTAYVLAVAACGWLGRLTAGPICGGLAALLIAWHPGVLDEVRIARSYGLILLLSSLSMAFLLRWLASSHRRRWLAGWAVTVTALMWTQYLTALVVAAQVLVLIVGVWRLRRNERKTAQRSLFAALAAVTIGCLPLLPAVDRLSGWGTVMDFQEWDPTMLQALGASWTIPALIVVAAGLLFGRTATLEGDTARWPVAAILAAWLIPLLLLGALVLTRSPMLAVPRYRVMMAPYAAIAISVSLIRLLRPAAAVVAAVAFLALCTVINGSSPLVARRLANPVEAEWKRIGLELGPRMASSATLVFTQTGLVEGAILTTFPDDPRLNEYVASRLGRFYTGSDRAIAIPLMWNGGPPTLRLYQKRLLSPAVREVWIVGATDTDLNAGSVEIADRVIQSHGYRRMGVDGRPGITVRRFERI